MKRTFFTGPLFRVLFRGFAELDQQIEKLRLLHGSAAPSSATTEDTKPTPTRRLLSVSSTPS